MITNTYTTTLVCETEIALITDILINDFNAMIISATPTMIIFNLTETPEILNNIESDLGLTKIN